MLKFPARHFISLGLLGLAVSVSATARAETFLVENQLNKFKFNGAVANPVTIEVSKGDVIEFKLTGNHGIVTIDKPVVPPPPESPVAAPQSVLACGQTANTTPPPPPVPNQPTVPIQVLREIECGNASKFNTAPLSGSLRLEVTDQFQGSVSFWCIIHEAGMWGTIKLKAEAAPATTPVRQ